MKYCSYCGTQINGDASFCPNCGAKVENNDSFAKSEPIDSAFTNPTGGYSYARKDYTESTGIAVLSFIFPLIGGILWLVNKDNKPGYATSALKGLYAWLCFNVIPILGIILYFVWKDSKPDFAKIGLIAGILGAIFSFIFGIIGGVVNTIISGYYTDMYALAFTSLI